VGICGHGTQYREPDTAQKLVADLEGQFWKEVFIPGTADEFNPELE
jgi:hypothetical protein